MSSHGIVERVFLILRKKKKWMTVRELAEEVERSGWRSHGKTAYNSIRGTISGEVTRPRGKPRLVRRRSPYGRKQYEYGFPEWE